MKKFNLSSSKLLTALAVFISRLGFLPANISPLGSFGFFSSSPILYGLLIICFDLFVKGTYSGFWITYIGFACYPLLGWLTRKNKVQQVIALPAASFLFFLISNFGVWLYWYDHSLANLALCYTLAIPFYSRTLLGDLLFGYGYLLIKQFVFVAKRPGSSYNVWHV